MGRALPLVLVDEEHGGGTGAPTPKPGRHLEAVGGRPEDVGEHTIVVLLVEDDAAMRMLVGYNLEAAGFRVVVATTGREALDLAASEQPDLVLLDVMLPDVGGFEVAEQLGELPVVFLSARTMPGDFERGRELGAIDYVAKPFDPVGLPARLREDLEELRHTGAGGVWKLRFGE